MFTIKLYKFDGAHLRLHEAESVTILSGNQGSSNGPCVEWSEITAHGKGGEGVRFDIGQSPYLPDGGVWEKAIIENGAGRITQIINHGPASRRIGEREAQPA